MSGTTNNGFILKKIGDQNIVGNEYGQFASANYSTSGSESRPVLEVTWTTAAPSKPSVTVDLKVAEKDGPITIPSGTAEILSWTSTNASFCYASVIGTESTWGGTIPTSGAQGTRNLTTPHTFTISCQDTSGDTAIDSVTVNISTSLPITYGTPPSPTASGQLELTLPVEYSTYSKGDSITVEWRSLSDKVGVWAISLEPNDKSLVNEIFLYGMKTPGGGGDPVLWVKTKTLKLPNESYLKPGLYRLKIWLTPDGVADWGVADSKFITITPSMQIVPDTQTTLGGTFTQSEANAIIAALGSSATPEVKALINALVTATPPSTTSPALPISNIGTFKRNLWRGMRGDDVKKLQELLGVTPRSGYFGAITEAAVQNFQCQYDIVCLGETDDTGYGLVGPRTRAKLKVVFGL